MQLSLSTDQEILRQTTRRFLGDEPTLLVRALAETAGGFDRGWWRQGAELGWTAPLVPEKYGGGSLAGEGLLDLVILAEELGRAAAAGPLAPVNVVADAIAGCGTDTQKERYLPRLASGELTATWCYAEHSSQQTLPWDGLALETTAAVVPNGFEISGSKTSVESGDQADLFLVTVGAPDGLTQFLVPQDTPGLTLTAMASLDLVRNFVTVKFDRAIADSASVLGAPGSAATQVERQAQLAIVLQCAESLGAVKRAFEETVRYMGDRYSFGRPLASYQALKHRVADMRMEIEACEAASDGAARSLQNGGQRCKESVSVAKAYIGDHADEIIQDCIQLHGGIGVTWEHDLHIYLRRVLTNRMSHGTPEAHREPLTSLMTSQIDAKVPAVTDFTNPDS